MSHFALIGYPLGHSLSPQIFAETFPNTLHTYTLLPVADIGALPQLIAQHKLQGFNITHPYKQAVIPLLHSLSPTAQAIGAVNTVKIEDGRLLGYNTDAPAFRDTLRPLLKPCHTQALVFGTGGAAAAVSFALRELGIAHLFVSRNPRQRNHISYAQAATLIPSYKMLINASPLGTGTDGRSPLAEGQGLTPQHLCYDLVYNPAETPFLKTSRQQGAQTLNGFAMLRRQAQQAYQIWGLL